MKPPSGVIGIIYDPSGLKEIKSVLSAHGQDKTAAVKPPLYHLLKYVYLHLTVCEMKDRFKW